LRSRNEYNQYKQNGLFIETSKNILFRNKTPEVYQGYSRTSQKWRLADRVKIEIKNWKSTNIAKV
jgi:hypothetical protein